MRVLAVFLLLLLLAACSHRSLTPGESNRWAHHLDGVEKIADLGAGELTVERIGELSVGDSRLPLHLVSRPTVGDGQRHVLILADAVAGDYRATEIVMETGRQLIADPSLFGRSGVDLIPALTAETFTQSRTGRPQLSRRDRKRLQKLLSSRLKAQKYDLIILHRTTGQQAGFVIKQEGGVQDAAAFAQSRLRDNGFFVAAGDPVPDHDFFAKDSLESFLVRKSGAPVVVFSSWAGEEREKAIFQHLLAQETVTRLLIQSFYR